MPDTIILAAEPESPGFHPQGKSGFSVRLSFETDIEISEADDPATQQKKESDARDRFGIFLAKLDKAEFALYRRNNVGDELTLSAFVQTRVPSTFDADLSKYFFEWLKASANSRIPFFAGQSDAEHVSADAVGAVHVLHGAATWTAPVPHRLGLTHILRFETADVEPGGAQLTDLVLVPFFDAAAPANTYTIAPGDPIEFEYASGLDVGPSKCRTGVIPSRLAVDATSLVDTDTGFVEGDTQSREFYAVLKRLDQKAGSLLGAFPAVLAVEWSSVQTTDGLPADADLITFCRLVWRAITSLSSSLDSIYIALTMPPANGGTGREGPLLAPLIDCLLSGFERSGNADTHSFYERPEEILKALKESVASLTVFTLPTPAQRENYANALAIASGLRSPAGQIDEKAVPLIAAALRAFAKDPNDDLSDEIATLKVAVFAQDAKASGVQLDELKKIPFDQLEKRHTIRLNERLNAELATIADAVQSEGGVESAVLRVLESGGWGAAAGPSIDKAFAVALAAADEAEVVLICAAAREEYRRLLAGGINGAEAVRQACSSVYVDWLMKTKPEDVASVATRLSNSDLFLARVDGPPPNPAPMPDADNPLRELVDLLVDPARPWFDKGNGGAGPETAPLREGFARVVEDLFPAEESRRFVPAHMPPPLPMQITVDQSTSELDDFANLFSGIALLVRRSDQKEDASPKEDWAYANLAELEVRGLKGVALPKPEIKGFFIHPMQTVEADGRRQLAVEYDGSPVASSAFDATMPDGMQADSERRPFFAIDYPDIPVQMQYRKLPKLAYGTELQMVGHVVSKGGVLPNALQDSTDAPWKPKPIVDPKQFPAKAEPRSIIQAFPYSRITAIGRTVITEDIGAPRRIGVAIEDVQPLAVDYPRSALSSAPSVFLDLLRNGDGTGAIAAPAIGEVSTLSLKDVWCWSEAGLIELSLLSRAGATADDEDGLRIEIPVAPGERGSFVLQLIRRPDDGGKPVYAANGKFEAGSVSSGELKLDSAPKSFWLRLRLVPQNVTGALWLSFADPTPEIRGPSAGSRPMPDNLVLIAEKSQSGIWKPDVPSAIAGRIELPRMGYLDFDRWLNNETLRTGAQGPADKAYLDEFRTKLLTGYLMRTVSEDLAARLDRLPDLAVAGLMLDVVPLDGLSASPQTLSTDPPFETPSATVRMTWIVGLPSLGERLRTIAPNIGAVGIKTLMKGLDESLSMSVVCEAAGGKLGIRKDGGRFIVRVPEGMAVRLSVRPLVAEKHFVSTDGFASVIDGRVRQLSCGRFTDTDALLGTMDEKYLVFEGAALNIERMMGPVSVRQPDPARKWQMQVEGLTVGGINEWAELVDIVLDGAHQPAGSARSYNLALDSTLPIAKSPRGWTWRQLGSIDIGTQRWRFTGRPIYNWIEPPDAPAGVASTRIVTDGALTPAALVQFEKEAFFDRDDLDAEVRTVTLDPVPAVTRALTVEWEKASATLFRHRFTVRSRYAGAMAKASDGTAPAWIRVGDDKPQGWFRVAMLADRSRLQLTRPQLRALIPLTTVPGDRAAPTPPVLAVIQEHPFEYGGLADRIASEVRTGIGYEVKVGKVEPVDARKEAGPDPRLTYRSMNADSAKGLVLQAEGPIGLTFDSSSAPAPAFPNSMFALQPKLLFGSGQRLEEHFLSVGLRRYLDPRWLTRHAPETPTFDRAWWSEFRIGALGLSRMDGEPSSPRVCWIEEIKNNDGKTLFFSVYLNPKSIDRTAQDVSTVPADKSRPQPLELSRLDPSGGLRFALLHVPLEEGRASLSIFALPAFGSADQASGGGNVPTLLASVDWALPPEWQSRALELDPHSDVRLTSASPVTPMNWARTNKNFGNAFLKYPVKNGSPFEGFAPVKALRAKFDRKFTLDIPDREVGDAWVLPEQWTGNFPLETQRHLGLLFSETSDGLGRPVEIVTTWCRLPARNAELKTPSHPKYARLVEFETRAAILGYRPAGGGRPVNDGVPPDYHAGYFDLRAVGFGRETVEVALSLFLRLVAGSSTKAGAKAITLTLRRDHDDVGAAITLTIENKTAKEVFGLYLDMEFASAGPAKCSGRILHGDGLLSDPIALDVTALRPETRTEGLVVKLVGLRADGGEQEGFLEASMLASSPSAPGPLPTADFSFDWIFTGKDQPPEAAISESGLRSTFEAQARLIYMSDPIPIEALT
jgi:hypothetical protein